MTINNIVMLLNNRLKSERLPLTKALVYLDLAVDDINQQMNTSYPVFTEVQAAFEEAAEEGDKLGDVRYDCFPDRYIRTALVAAAAYHFFQDDEEGMVTAEALREEAAQYLFYMVRDYLHAVPEEYKDCDFNGTVQFALNGEGGLVVNGYRI